MRKEFQIGDEVTLVLTPTLIGIVPEMWKYDGQTFRISRICYKKLKEFAKGAVYYELEGCVSEAGVPFSILREWIYPYGGMSPAVTAACVSGGN